MVGECAYEFLLDVDAGGGGRGAPISFDQPVEPGLPVCRSTCKDPPDLFTFQRSTPQKPPLAKATNKKLEECL